MILAVIPAPTSLLALDRGLKLFSSLPLGP